MRNEAVVERSKTRIAFKNEDIDFWFMSILGFISASGATIGECFNAAKQINKRSKDPERWFSVFHELGDVNAQLARQAEGKGHVVSAREAYLRAYTYHRFSRFGLAPSDPRAAQSYHDAVAYFQSACGLLDVHVEPIAIPYKDILLPGYIFSPDRHPQPRPTLLVVSGGDGYAEDIYFVLGEAGVLRGYNVISYDHPGDTNFPYIRPGFQIPNEPEGSYLDALRESILGYVLDLPWVDKDRFGALGLSGGGWRLMNLASNEDRFKALIFDAPIYDMGSFITSSFPPFLLKKPSLADKLFSLFAKLNPYSRIQIEQYLFGSGGSIKRVSEWLDLVSRAGDVDPTTIKAPTLCLVGESESEEQRRQAAFVYDSLMVRKKDFHEFSFDEGADAHCQFNNFPLLQQKVFDWLSEVLE